MMIGLSTVAADAGEANLLTKMNQGAPALGNLVEYSQGVIHTRSRRTEKLTATSLRSGTVGGCLCLRARPKWIGMRSRHRKHSSSTTSRWVVDEKAYAFAKEKKLVLIKEFGVQSIGGLQGDYEYLEFKRDEPTELLIKLVELFHGPAD